MAQEKEYLEAAIEAQKAVERIAKKITKAEAEKKQLEDEHGITELKKEIRDLKLEMEATAYSIIKRAPMAAQGRLFEEIPEARKEDAA